jgi:hypothetical protein
MIHTALHLREVSQRLNGGKRYPATMTFPLAAQDQEVSSYAIAQDWCKQFGRLDLLVKILRDYGIVMPLSSKSSVDANLLQSMLLASISGAETTLHFSSMHTEACGQPW